MFFQILNVVLVVVMTILVIVVKGLPKHISEIMMENMKHKNAKELQVESYFKELGGKQQLEILSVWTNLLVDLEYMKKMYGIDSKGSVERYNKLIHDTFIYGSDKTVKLLSLYTSSMYRGNTRQAKLVMYIAYIASSLKEDFTGYSSSPQTLLQLKLTDYEQNTEEFIEMQKEIEHELRE